MGRERSLAAEQRAEQRMELRLGCVSVGQMHRHVEVDAGERMDLVRLLDVRRTPTVFVLGPGGQITRRGSGLMSKADVLGALDEIRAG